MVDAIKKRLNDALLAPLLAMVAEQVAKQLVDRALNTRVHITVEFEPRAEVVGDEL